MLSAAVHRTSRDVSIMKEKLIFSGMRPRSQAEAGSEPHCTCVCAHTSHAAHR